MNIDKQGLIDDSCSGTCPRYNDNDNAFVANETDINQSEIANKINNNNNIRNNNNNNTTAIEPSSANVPATKSIELSGCKTDDNQSTQNASCEVTSELSNASTAVVDESNVNKSDTTQMAKISTDTKSAAVDAAANTANNDTTLAAEATTATAIEPQRDLLNVAANNVVETICDEVATAEDIKRLKHVQGRSNSTGKLYHSSRRVSFPENDKELVTGYLEPADPWASG